MHGSVDRVILKEWDIYIYIDRQTRWELDSEQI